MTKTRPAPELLAQLEQQISFLDRSCLAYDRGEVDDAIRIATTIRVIIHNTKNSTSLLKHLNATTINLHSTVEDIEEHWIGYRGMGVVSLSTNGTHGYAPSLDNSPIHSYIPVSKWWDQVIFLTEKARLTRRKIVLAASNQDGGAHVDANLDTLYAQSKQPGFGGVIETVHGSKLALIPLENSHLLSLRQMGYELLTSPELHALRDA